MPRDYKSYIEDMDIAIGKINEYTSSLSNITLPDDQMLYDAVLYNLQRIGEAAKQISEEIKNAYPEVEWRKISGLRDIIAHEYFGISVDIIWDVVKNKLPPLHITIKKILEEM